MKFDTLRRHLRTLLLLGVVLVGVLTLIELALPWIGVKTGISSGYQVGTLRFGRAEFAHWWERTSSRALNEPHRVGVVLAPGDAGLRLRWESDIERGDPGLVVRTFPGRDVLWRAGLASEGSAGETIIPLRGSTFYWISLSKVRWTGRATITWNVVDR